MTASSQAVRSASVAANGADSSRMRSASIGVAIGGQEGLHVDLVLRPERYHLGKDQAFCRGHPDHVAFRPLDGARIGKRLRISEPTGC